MPRFDPYIGIDYSGAKEVYPAATLVAHRMRSKGYKKPAQSVERYEILNVLKGLLRIRESVTDLSKSADLIDAAVCVLTGCDFSRGGAMKPEDPGLAEREGWIWSLPLQNARAVGSSPR